MEHAKLVTNMILVQKPAKPAQSPVVIIVIQISLNVEFAVLVFHMLEVHALNVLITV